MKKIILCFCMIHAAFSVSAKRIADTVIVGESLNSFTLDRENPYVVLQMRIDYEKLAQCKSLYLRFETIMMEHPPEGIYEVYLVDSLPDIGALESTSRFFVHVINTYYLSDRSTVNQLMNMGSMLGEMKRNKKRNRSYCLVIVFRGNTLPDKSFSREAGMLRVKAVRLVGAGSE